MKKISRFKWSGGVVAITVVTLVFVAGGVVFVSLVKSAPWVVRYAVGLPLVGCIAWVATWIPLWLSVGDDGVVLKKVVGRIVIPAREIVEMRRIDKDVLRGSVRTFGSGGLFGFLGRFWNKRLGKYTMYITQWRNLLLIRTEDKTYVFNYRGKLPEKMA
jgi:hypothetical protein